MESLRRITDDVTAGMSADPWVAVLERSLMGI
jgi:hypothetical protein